MHRTGLLLLLFLTVALASCHATFHDTVTPPPDDSPVPVDKTAAALDKLPPILIAPNDDPWGNISRETWDWLRAKAGNRVGWLCKLSHHYVDPDLDFQIDVNVMRAQLKRAARQPITPVAFAFSLEGPYTPAIRNPHAPEHQRAVDAIRKAIAVGRTEMPDRPWAFRGMMPNGPRQLRHADDWLAVNRAMRPVWQAGDYIYLNLYTWRPFSVDGQEDLYRRFVRFKVDLARTVAPDKPIIACVWHRHRDPPDGPYLKHAMSLDDWQRSLEIIRDAGITHVSWWGADPWMSDSREIKETPAQLAAQHRAYAEIMLRVFQ